MDFKILKRFPKDIWQLYLVGMFLFKVINKNTEKMSWMLLEICSKVTVKAPSELTFTYSKSVVETLKNYGNMFKINNKNTRNELNILTFLSWF